MDGLGYGTDNITYLEEVAALNSYEMSQHGTDWAFTIFVVYVAVFWWNDKTVDQGGYLASRRLAGRARQRSRKP